MSDPYDSIATRAAQDPYAEIATPAKRNARQTAGYAKARGRLAKEDAQRKSINNRFGLGGFDGFTAQIARNTGASDEVGGAMRFLAQGAENAIRRVAGRKVETTAGEAGLAAMDAEREAQARYARDRPGLNVAASVLGMAAAGRPTGGAPITNWARAGATAAVQNAPFAVARQEGSLRDRAPGAAVETALTFGMGAGLTAGANRLRVAAQRSAARPPSPQRQISQQGVNLTPGQMAGGAVQRIEDGLTSVPIFGDAIRSAKVRGIEGFNRAALNRTLGQIGETLPAGTNVGRDGLRVAAQRISQHYDNALQGVQLAPDQAYAQEFQAVLHTPNLTGAQRETLEQIMGDLANRFSGPIDGNLWKVIDADLGKAIRAADSASQNAPGGNLLTQALQRLKVAHDGLLQRANSGAHAGVEAADAATANLARIRQASQYTGSSARDGMFSPADLNRAVQGMDTSAGNRAFAQGDALMQDLTDPAMQVLPQTVPDSGTPFRSLMAVGGVGGGAAAAGADPVAVAGAVGGLTAASAIYSRPVLALLNGIYRATTPGQQQANLAQLGTLAARNPQLAQVYQQAAEHLGLTVEGPVPVGAQ